MCVVSFIGDHYTDKWNQPYYQRIITNVSDVSRAEFDKLKEEVEEMKKLLIGAKLYDEKNNEPECELEEKMMKLREIAKLVGINLDDVLKK